MSKQNDAILHYLYTTGKPLTNRSAMFEINIAKLSTRVSELRRDGWDLPHKMVKNETNSGQHAVYYMSVNDMEKYYNEVTK